MKPILCLDFDGVLHRYDSGWRGPRCIPDPPVPGAMAFVLAARQRFRLAVHSSRARYLGGRRAMRAWLVGALVDHQWETIAAGRDGLGDLVAMGYGEDIRRWARQVVAGIAFPRWKPAAMVTLDDRALTFTGAWPSIEELEAFRPWNKRAPKEAAP